MDMRDIHAKEKPAVLGNAPIRDRGSFVVFGKPDIGQDEIDSVAAVISSRWIGAGPETRRFEDSFANYIGAQGAVAVNSATAALHLAMQVLDVGPGDEVITTAMTFCATVSAILHAGATPVLCDCDPETGNILPEQIAARITPRTRAIIVVHMYGRICDMGPIMSIADAPDCRWWRIAPMRWRPPGTAPMRAPSGGRLLQLLRQQDAHDRRGRHVCRP